VVCLLRALVGILGVALTCGATTARLTVANALCVDSSARLSAPLGHSPAAELVNTRGFARNQTATFSRVIATHAGIIPGATTIPIFRASADRTDADDVLLLLPLVPPSTVRGPPLV
jgi:hypothetical protein